MATVRIKFRPSAAGGTIGNVYYQITHKKVVRRLKTTYNIYGNEWDMHLSRIELSNINEDRRIYLSETIGKINKDLQKLNRIISGLEQNDTIFTADDIINEFKLRNNETYLFQFMEDTIIETKALGKIRKAETYATTLNSFRRFRENRDLRFKDFNTDIIVRYEAYLHNNGVCPNSSSFYIRNLRAVYNRAVEKGLIKQKYPFKHVYTGVERTIKRAVHLSTIKMIKDMDLSKNPALDLARDMFLFSFYTRGMSFVDMAYLKKEDLSGDVLSYRRHKTGQHLSIHWEKCMKSIAEKYIQPHSPYLLPIIKSESDTNERRQYIYAAHNINRSLKVIGRRLGLTMPLTMYVARHSWASIARSKNIPIAVISEGMGHDSESTTRIYLASLSTNVIDDANNLILESL